jgi:hypothetical protein
MTGMRIRRWFRVLWAFPNTAWGVLFLLLALLAGQQPTLIDGVIEISGGPIGFFLKHCVPLRGGASAMTLGHVVLGRDHDGLERTRRHERVHVRQAEIWGPFFLPAYAAAGVLAVAQGRNFYWDNVFEKSARGEQKSHTLKI